MIEFITGILNMGSGAATASSPSLSTMIISLLTCLWTSVGGSALPSAPGSESDPSDSSTVESTESCTDGLISTHVSSAWISSGTGSYGSLPPEAIGFIGLPRWRSCGPTDSRRSVSLPSSQQLTWLDTFSRNKQDQERPCTTKGDDPNTPPCPVARA